jgi:hypothetical protein
MFFSLCDGMLVAFDFVERIYGLASLGGTQGWRYVQWAFGFLRFLDEYESARRDLHIQRR